MKKSKRLLIIIPAILVALCMPGLSFGKAVLEKPEGTDPPFGLAYGSDAGGTKIHGFATLEYYNDRRLVVFDEDLQQYIVPDVGSAYYDTCSNLPLGDRDCCDQNVAYAATTEPTAWNDVRAVLQLRMNNEVHTFFGNMGNVEASVTDANQQELLQGLLGCDVIEAFFGTGTCGNYDVGLKSVALWSETEADTNLTGIYNSEVPMETEFPDGDDEDDYPDYCVAEYGGSMFFTFEIDITLKKR